MKTRTANVVVQVLTWRLRELRIRAGVVEIEQAMAALRTQETWTDSELEQIVLPIFAKRREQRLIVSRLLAEIIASPGPEEGERPSATASPPIVLPKPRPRRPPETIWETVARILGTVLTTKITVRILWSLGVVLALCALSLAFSGLIDTISDQFNAILTGLAGAFHDPLGTGLLKEGPDSEGLQVALLVRHAVVSFLAASAVVLVLIALRLTIKKPDTGVGPREPFITRRAVTGDESVFRVGSLGGPPPPFLDPALASEIVELISYRQTDRVRTDLDLRSTVGRRVRGEMDSLVFQKRKELPTVAVLVDCAADGRHWNTLATEFQVALEKRGLRVEILPFYSSLSRPSSYANTSADTVEATLTGLADRTGWMLTTVFANLRRLSTRDIAILVAQQEQGPVLAFDYVDPRLWDFRHVKFETKDMGPFPATGYALRQALATSFAPDRGATRAAKSASSGKAVSWHLSQPHIEWAIACAMVEPVSFALAEKLRKAHPLLSGPSEALAFSLLSALPESWISREGLHFSPQIRRDLLSRASELSRDLQVAFLEVFDAAFGNEPQSITAGELWRYTRAQAELFTFRQARAFQDLADVKAGGIIDADAFDDFVGRLRQPGTAIEPGSIVLRSATPKLPRVLPTDQTSTPPLNETQFANWSVGLSEVRIRANSQIAPLATFFAEGQSFLTIDKGGAEPFSRVDAVRGVRQAMTQLTPLSNFNILPSDFTQVYMFSNGEGGVLAARPGRLFTMLKGNESEQGLIPNMALQEIKTETDLGHDPLVALSPDGKRIAYARAGSLQIAVVATSADERPEIHQAAKALTAIAFSQRGSILCGDTEGNVFEFSSDDRSLTSSAADQQPIASFPAPVSALCDFVDDSGDRRVVVGLSDGRVGIGPGLPLRSFDLLAWRPRWLTVFADRKAAVVGSRTTGLSIAVTGADGEFDIIGLDSDGTGQFEPVSLLDSSLDPSRDGRAVLAINAERRRIIMRNGSYLEVRPLVYDLPDVEEVDSPTNKIVPSEPAFENDRVGSAPA
ncbi:hypothetical protein [Rhizobium sp. 768_B6_N1_8]|uniref:hypothetical protein n=1 Tax=unclassified Rhizobium TaxID=2613769 RepID=UPI003F28E6D0